MEKRRFQWLKGDRQGVIEQYKNSIRENDTNFIVFQSGRRASVDLLGDYITEISEEGEPFISSALFDTNFVQQKIEKVKPVNNTNTVKKDDSPSILDIVKTQLDKNTEFIKINIEIPVLKKDLFNILLDAHPDLIKDLSKIINDKYINKTSIEESVKTNLTDYYINQINFEKEKIITLKTEKL